MTWTPTAESINALPEWARDYIHLLETNTDPAGEIRRRVLAETRVAELEAMIAEAPEGRAKCEWLGPTLAEFSVRAEGDDVMRFADAALHGKRVRLVVVDE